MNKQISDTEIETEYMQICFFKTSTLEFSYLFAIIFRILLYNIIEILKTFKVTKILKNLLKLRRNLDFQLYLKFFIIYSNFSLYICKLLLTYIFVKYL